MHLHHVGGVLAMAIKSGQAIWRPSSRHGVTSLSPCDVSTGAYHQASRACTETESLNSRRRVKGSRGSG